MNKVYLAGPITGLSYDESDDWRDYVQQQFARKASHIKGYSPLRGKQYLKEFKQIADSYDEWPLSTPRGITVRDRFDCKTSDVVLVNLLNAERISIGTVLEIGWASAYDIPVFTVMDEGNIHDHAMIRETSSIILPTLDQAVNVICSMLTSDFTYNEQ